MNNPLLSTQQLPDFSKVLPEHIEPALDQILTENRAQIQYLLTNKPFTWNSFAQPIEDIDERLAKMWSVVGHLHHVVSTKPLREAYEKCIPKLTEYSTELAQNIEIFNAYQSIKNGPEFSDLNQTQQKIINNALRDFKLTGVTLPEKKKKRYKELQTQLAKLTNNFSENLLDATDAWGKSITDKSLLKGLPEHALISAERNAKNNKQQGWLLNLEFPCYFAVITYADNRELREEIYTAYVTRASDQGPHAKRWDNSVIIADILKYRHELAQLLNFDSYAEYSLATKMAKQPQQVMDFLNQLAERSTQQAKREWQELTDFAKSEYEVDKLQAWDVAYFSEKLRQQKHAISQEELRPYFPENQVLDGLFNITERLYDVKIKKPESHIDTWHKDVRYFEVYNNKAKLIAGFYLDLFARPHKQGGAWMDSCRNRHRDANRNLQLPITFLTCNLTPPTNSNPALFTHDEVVTLFHEFGHGLHHMLTQIDCASVAGTNGVAWDAIELPSQFMENWCWQKEALKLISSHYKTNEILPSDLLEKLLKAKNFQSGMQMVRQLEFSLFDFRIHLEYKFERGDQTQAILNEVREAIAVVPAPDFNRFQHGFSHIFAGGYAAGYYSYKWAEVLSSDAFTLFEKNGIFDKATAQSFLKNILTKGGSEEPMDLFVSFRGRKPQIDALLKHSGIE